jgi:hypothetical protein
MTAFAAKYNERVLHSPHNNISIGSLRYQTNMADSDLTGIGMSLSTLCGRDQKVSFFGSILFSKCVSGTRLESIGITIKYD